MTDLHCHILPNIDDGAKDVSISLRLLEKEYADGVRNIAFTSHFNSEWTTPDAFLQKRAAAYETLTAALPTGPEAMQFRFKLGCEVYFSPKLCELDAKALCIGDTSYMLVEFPTTHKPHFIRQTFALLQEQGVLPLIAHIERYPYVLEDPTLLYNWVAAGAYVQINAGALLDSPKLRRTLCKFISWQLVHVISTDTHSLDKRPPRMAEAAAVLEKELGRETASKLPSIIIKRTETQTSRLCVFSLLQPHRTEVRLTGKYRYLTFEDRKKIEAWHLLGDRPVDIAARLSVHHTTIYKELQRGATGALDANQREGYSAELAERRLRESFKRRGKRAPAAQ